MGLFETPLRLFCFLYLVYGYMFLSFRSGKFSVIILSNTVLTLSSVFSFWDPYKEDVSMPDVVPKVP